MAPLAARATQQAQGHLLQTWFTCPDDCKPLAVGVTFSPGLWDQLSLRMVRDPWFPRGSFGALLPGCGRDMQVTGVFVGWSR